MYIVFSALDVTSCNFHHNLSYALLMPNLFRFPGFMRKCIGVLAYWCIGDLVSRCIGALVPWCPGALAHWCLVVHYF